MRPFYQSVWPGNASVTKSPRLSPSLYSMNSFLPHAMSYRVCRKALLTVPSRPPAVEIVMQHLPPPHQGGKQLLPRNQTSHLLSCIGHSSHVITWNSRGDRRKRLGYLKTGSSTLMTTARSRTLALAPVWQAGGLEWA
jgi:hypothetical protein